MATIASKYGHDGFLLEYEAIQQEVQELLKSNTGHHLSNHFWATSF
jgi:hypothetical protein